MTNPLPISPPVLLGLAAAAAAALILLVAGKVPLAYNLRNLAVRWRVTVLTALAFTLVVAPLTVMLGFVNGMDRLTAGSGQPGNVIVLYAGAADELFSTLALDVTGEIAREPGVQRDERGRPLCSRELYVVVTQPVPGPPGQREQRRFVQVRGIEDPEIALRVHGLELLPGGTWFSPAGVREVTAADGRAGPEQAVEAILGEGVARELGRDQHKERLAVGDVFELGPKKWVVVGVMKAGGSTFNSEVWAKSQKVGDQFGKQYVFSSVVLRTPDPETARDVCANLKTYKKAALQARPEPEYYAKLAETNKQFLYAVHFIAAVMAAGGVFGVMNTMFAATSQRGQDIGILRILGFARRQILVSFLVETLLIALLGGLLGTALGCLADGRTATSIVSSGQGGGKTVVLEVAVDANVVAIGILFTLAMGCLGGLLPALAAMRLKQLAAVR